MILLRFIGLLQLAVNQHGALCMDQLTSPRVDASVGMDLALTAAGAGAGAAAATGAVGARPAAGTGAGAVLVFVSEL